MKNKLLTKTMAVLIAMITIFSSTTIGFTAGAVPGTSAGNYASAFITTGIGAIPFIGKGLSKALEPLLLSAFGINSTENIMAKLDEILDRIDDLELKLDENTQEILESLYDAKLDGFNDDLTALKVAVEKLYNRLAIIESGCDIEYEKEILTAELIKFDYRYTDDIVVTTEKLSKYVDGTQFRATAGDGIYTHTYKAMCTTSIIGSEAGYKAAAYVSQVNDLLSNAYKLIEIVLSEKIYVADNIENIDALCESNPEFKKHISGYDLSLYRNPVNRAEWSSLLGTETTGYVGDYNRLFSNDNENSEVSKYNKMIEDNWFNYIRSAKFTAKSVEIEYVPLSSEMAYTTAEECGLSRAMVMNPFERQKMPSKVFKAINSTVKSTLTKDEIIKLYTLFGTNDLYCKDKDGNQLTLFAALCQYGFSFKNVYNNDALIECFKQGTDVKEFNREPVLSPIFSTGAEKTHRMNLKAVSFEDYYSLTGYNPLAESFTEMSHDYMKDASHIPTMDKILDKDFTPYAIIYFAPAA